jgi:ArsR family transcriptional regulator, arsenate/arsenite/antimonite-responsive transcriptional repressor
MLRSPAAYCPASQPDDISIHGIRPESQPGYTPGCPDTRRERRYALDKSIWRKYHIAMNFLTDGQYEARARVAKALAHPTRLQLLDALKQKAMCVGELTRLIGDDQSTVSKHLAILKNAGLVEGRREGLVTLYRVRCACLDGFFSCMENVLRQNLKTQQAAVARR